MESPQTLPAIGVSESLIPLQLHMESCATQEEMNRNVELTLKRGYTRINEYLDTVSGSVSICGAGPSLRKRWRELKDLGADVMACNSAIGFLIEKGVPPKWGMIWDASPLCANFVSPHEDTTYLIGARCHPDVFEKLKECKVIVWHAGGDHNISHFLATKGVNEPMVNGGSAAVTRALYVAVALGYRSMNVLGADSSYDDDGSTHVNGASLVPEKDFVIFVGNDEGKKSFRTTPEWCAQIEEFKLIYGNFRMMGIPIKSYCDGMWQHVAGLLEIIHNYPLGQPHMQQIHGMASDGEFIPNSPQETDHARV